MNSFVLLEEKEKAKAIRCISQVSRILLFEIIASTEQVAHGVS